MREEFDFDVALAALQDGQGLTGKENIRVPPLTSHPFCGTGIDRATSIAGHSRVQSSFRLTVRNFLPLASASMVKSRLLVGGDRAPGAFAHALGDFLAIAAAQGQALLSVKSLHHFHVHLETLLAKLGMQHAIAIASVFAGKRDQPFPYPRMAIRPSSVFITRSGKPNQPTGPPS